MQFFVIFRCVRDILRVTVAFDHPVSTFYYFIIISLFIIYLFQYLKSDFYNSCWRSWLASTLTAAMDKEAKQSTLYYFIFISLFIIIYFCILSLTFIIADGGGSLQALWLQLWIRRPNYQLSDQLLIGSLSCYSQLRYTLIIIIRGDFHIMYDFYSGTNGKSIWSTWRKIWATEIKCK